MLAILPEQLLNGNMNIPEPCRGCPELERIQQQPIMTFREAMAQVAGKAIASVGYSGTTRLHDRQPTFVTLLPNGEASRQQIHTAWTRAMASRDRIQSDVIDQLEDCPGMLEASSKLDGETLSFQVCGKMAIEAARASDV